jgi:hypothetical protein
MEDGFYKLLRANGKTTNLRLNGYYSKINTILQSSNREYIIQELDAIWEQLENIKDSLPANDISFYNHLRNRIFEEVRYNGGAWPGFSKTIADFRGDIVSACELQDETQKGERLVRLRREINDFVVCNPETRERFSPLIDVINDSLELMKSTPTKDTQTTAADKQEQKTFKCPKYCSEKMPDSTDVIDGSNLDRLAKKLIISRKTLTNKALISCKLFCNPNNRHYWIYLSDKSCFSKPENPGRPRNQ